VGDGPDSSWEDLRKSIELARSTGGGGHVLWYSRGVLDLGREGKSEVSEKPLSPRFSSTLFLESDSLLLVTIWAKVGILLLESH
jgi:hypothetical protein